MYLWLDEVVRVLENVGFEWDYIVDQVYGYWKVEYYVYVNWEVCMGRIVLVIYLV